MYLKEKGYINGININTYKTFVEIKNIESPCTRKSYENLLIIKLLELYTKTKDMQDIKNYLYNLLKKDVHDVIFTYNNSSNVHNLIILNYCNIPFELISEMEGLSEEKKKELASPNRQKKCHLRSIEYSLLTKDTKVLTGLIRLGEKSLIHSVVEISSSDSGDSKILDYTRNLIIDKQKYIELFEFNILNEVYGEDLLRDLDLFNQNDLHFKMKFYLIFRDEIMNNFQKNISLLKR